MATREQGKGLSESDVIAHYFAPLSDPDTSFGLRDDAAFLSVPPDQDLVISKDMLVADIHFFPNDPADQIARKALRVNLSDLASKGAKPVGYLLGLGLPDGWSEEWLTLFCEGLKQDQTQFDLPLIGGDTVKSPERLTLSITIFGYVPKNRKIIRTQAKAGDSLFVTGTIGDSALGLLARGRGGVSLPTNMRDDHINWLKQRYLLPQPRLSMHQLLLDHASAAMDISDGLLGDAQKLAKASNVGVQIELDKVPLSDAAKSAVTTDLSLLSHALSGGDDYELLFTVPAHQLEAFQADCETQGQSVTQIGIMTHGAGISLLDSSGKPASLDGALSFEHF